MSPSWSVHRHTPTPTLFGAFLGIAAILTAAVAQFSPPARADACAPVSTDQLAAYWKFDEGTGFVAHDTTAYDNAGWLQSDAAWTGSGAPLLSADPSALTLDGTGDYVFVPATSGLPSGSAARTIALWMRRDGDAPQATLFSLGDRDNGSQKFILQMGGTASGTAALFTDGVNATNNIALTGSQIPGAGWHHVALSFDGGSVWNYYLDGVLVKSGTFAVPINTMTNAAEIGSRHDAVNGFFHGSLDDVRVYGRALGASEIASLAGGCGNEGSPSSSSSSTSSPSSSSSSTSSSSSGTVPLCHGTSATIYVKNGRVVGGPLNGKRFMGILRGTNGNDVIAGTGGGEIIGGKGGDDIICGNGGRDVIYSDGGNDAIYTGGGQSIVFDRPGNGFGRGYGVRF